MVYITLKELKKILPGILDQWIDEDDESWEWIFQEIEQKCHVGKKKVKKTWKNYAEDDIFELKRDICDLNGWLKELDKKYDELRNKISNLGDKYTSMVTKVNHMYSDINAAKSMAETAKECTEIDYSKYSGKSDGKVNYSKEAKKLNEELNSMTSNDIAQWCKEQNSKNLQSCTTCKHYNEGAIEDPCIQCTAYQYWEAKENE